MILFAFDRDKTVDVNQGPVPLALVKHLAFCTPHEVWATGNQALCAEAGIPGIDQILIRARALGIEVDRMRELGAPSVQHAIHRDRVARLELLAKLFPRLETRKRIVVDDADLSALEDWVWYAPARFMENEGRQWWAL